MSRAQQPDVIVDDVECLRDTELAILVDVDGEEMWIPRSQLRKGNQVTDRGDCGQLIISRWIAEQKGLV